MAAADSPNVKFPPPFVYMLAFFAGLGLHRLLGHDIPPASWRALLRPAGLIVMGIAMAFDMSALITFRRAGTSVVPVRPARALVERGPYRFTRNPMYLGLAVLYVGVSLLIERLWPLALLPVAILVIDRAVIAREERYLTARFGEAYTGYQHRVGRWLGRRAPAA